MKKTMIIVWKWKDFKDLDTKDKKTNIGTDYIADIPKGEGITWDAYTVVGKTNQGTELVKGSQIVRTLVKNNCEEGKNFLNNLINYHSSKGGRVFVFLHRSDNYTENDIARILKDSPANRCFLIGGGRDFIYFNPKSGEGLLGHNGIFYRRSASPNKTKIEVADKEKKEVFHAYFDRVWHYYKHEFKIKFFELKTDILWHFLGSTKENIDAKILALSGANNCLYLRIKNFLAEKLNDTELTALKGYERDAHKSYFFDDCQKNLERQPTAQQKYKALQKLLKDTFITHTHQKPSDLKAIQTGFNALIKAC